MYFISSPIETSVAIIIERVDMQSSDVFHCGIFEKFENWNKKFGDRFRTFISEVKRS